MKKLGIFIIILVLAAVVATFWHRTSRGELKISDSTIQVDIADTDALREQGLSGKEALCADCGMLFVFDSASEPGFWMKDMKFPIDIVWISAQKKIVGVENSVSPTSYPDVFYPKEPVLYVLELPAGFVLERHIDTGAEVNFSL
ncbi:DUF192 domain-containing protein [Candidatus Parcubacteria bacterium]|nr:DUF192 domain-containing protein [Candidatus Parcubacteria bacterium]